MQRFLKQGGHEVLLADDGFDALSKVNDYQPQLIFCDILMPKLDAEIIDATQNRLVIALPNNPKVLIQSKLV